MFVFFFFSRKKMLAALTLDQKRFIRTALRRLHYTRKNTIKEETTIREQNDEATWRVEQYFDMFNDDVSDESDQEQEERQEETAECTVCQKRCATTGVTTCALSRVEFDGYTVQGLFDNGQHGMLTIHGNIVYMEADHCFLCSMHMINIVKKFVTEESKWLVKYFLMWDKINHGAIRIKVKTPYHAFCA